MNIKVQNTLWCRLAGVTFCGILVFLSLGLGVYWFYSGERSGCRDRNER
jgi:hypothetical protein